MNKPYIEFFYGFAGDSKRQEIPLQEVIDLGNRLLKAKERVYGRRRDQEVLIDCNLAFGGEGINVRIEERVPQTLRNKNKHFISKCWASNKV